MKVSCQARGFLLLCMSFVTNADGNDRGWFLFSQVVMGEYEWATYGSVFTRLCNFGKGLFTLGLEAGSMLAIYSETRADWMVAAQACFRYNLPSTSLKWYSVLVMLGYYLAFSVFNLFL